MVNPDPQAAQHYRDVVLAMTAGFDGDAARNQERVDVLRHQLVELGRDLVAASEQHVVARVGNLLAWEDALEILWVESWMTMKPFPKPNPLAKGDPDELVTAVEARVAELRALVQRRGLRR